MEKKENLEYIKKFSEIKVSKICDKLKVARQNIFTGKASDENLEKVRREIEEQIAKLYIRSNNAEERKDTL